MRFLTHLLRFGVHEARYVKLPVILFHVNRCISIFLPFYSAGNGQWPGGQMRLTFILGHQKSLKY